MIHSKNNKSEIFSKIVCVISKSPGKLKAKKKVSKDSAVDGRVRDNRIKLFIRKSRDSPRMQHLKFEYHGTSGLAP